MAGVIEGFFGAYERVLHGGRKLTFSQMPPTPGTWPGIQGGHCTALQMQEGRRGKFVGAGAAGGYQTTRAKWEGEWGS